MTFYRYILKKIIIAKYCIKFLIELMDHPVDSTQPHINTALKQNILFKFLITKQVKR